LIIKRDDYFNRYFKQHRFSRNFACIEAEMSLVLAMVRWYCGGLRIKLIKKI